MKKSLITLFLLGFTLSSFNKLYSEGPNLNQTTPQANQELINSYNDIRTIPASSLGRDGQSGQVLTSQGSTQGAHWAAAGGGSSTFILGVGTGTASNFTTAVTSPTNNISFLGSQFTSLAGGTTNFISLINVVPVTLIFSTSTSGTSAFTFTSLDSSLYNHFDITITTNTTINGPINPKNAEKIVFRILNSTNTFTVIFATGTGNFRFGATFSSYTNSVSSTDYLGAIYSNSSSKWDLVSESLGFN